VEIVKIEDVELLACKECKWKYPDELLNPIVTSLGSSGLICGICALELTNQIHGIKRKRFNGQMAEHMRLDAIIWRKKHPEHKPSEKTN
jgi:hypothetical protein